MITVISGRLGRGKSYHACTLAIKHLLSGGVVASNMTLDRVLISKIWGRRILPWQVIHIDAAMDPVKIPRGDFRGSGRRRVMVVLDEALNWFESGGSKDPRRESWGVWLRQSDKLGQDVFFVAQQFERAAKWIRELAAIEVRITNMKDFGIGPFKVGAWLRLDKLYCASSFDVQSGQACGWKFGCIVTSVCRCYKTAELYGFVASDSAYISDIWPAFRLPRWVVVVPLVCAVYHGVKYALAS